MKKHFRINTTQHVMRLALVRKLIPVYNTYKNREKPFRNLYSNQTFSKNLTQACDKCTYRAGPIYNELEMKILVLHHRYFEKQLPRSILVLINFAVLTSASLCSSKYPFQVIFKGTCLIAPTPISYFSNFLFLPIPRCSS